MWEPDQLEIGRSETLGRRIFGSPFAGSKGKVPEGAFKLTHFLDTRWDTDLSFDRLGRTGIDNTVRKFVTPLARAQGAAQKKEFTGWAAIRMVDLDWVEVRPTPTDDPKNPYHADLSRDGFREKRQAETLAFRLSVLAGREVVSPLE